MLTSERGERNKGSNMDTDICNIMVYLTCEREERFKVVRVMLFNATFNNISVSLVEETGEHRENHQPAASS